MKLFKRKRADVDAAQARGEELRAAVAESREEAAAAAAAFDEAALAGDRKAIDDARAAVDFAAARERVAAAGVRASERDAALAREERTAEERRAHLSRALELARERLGRAERFDELVGQLGECCAEYSETTLGIDVECQAAGLPPRRLHTATHWRLRSALWHGAPDLCRRARLAPLIGGRKTSLAEDAAPEVAQVEALGEGERS